MNEIILNKKISIERCVAQVRKYYAMTGDLPFEKDHLRQDAIAMNLQRISELAIDIANHLIKRKNSAYRRTAPMRLSYCTAPD